MAKGSMNVIGSDFGKDVKTMTIFDGHSSRRERKGFLLQADLSMLFLVFAALITLRNYVLEHLTNVIYVT
jgi:hypothetical protein